MELRDEVTGFATDHRVVVGEGSDWSVYVGNVIHFPIPVEVTLVDFILTVHVVVLGVGTHWRIDHRFLGGTNRYFCILRIACTHQGSLESVIEVGIVVASEV